MVVWSIMLIALMNCFGRTCRSTVFPPPPSRLFTWSIVSCVCRCEVPSKSVSPFLILQQASRDQYLERAETLLRKALKIRERAFGSDSQRVIKTKVALAGVVLTRVSVVFSLLYSHEKFDHTQAVFTVRSCLICRKCSRVRPRLHVPKWPPVVYTRAGSYLVPWTHGRTPIDCAQRRQTVF